MKVEDIWGRWVRLSQPWPSAYKRPYKHGGQKVEGTDMTFDDST